MFHRDSLKALAMLTQIGITMVVAIGLGLFVGKFLDQKLNTSPIFLLSLSLFGIVVGFRNVYHITRSFVKNPSTVEQKEAEVLKQIKEEDRRRQRHETK